MKQDKVEKILEELKELIGDNIKGTKVKLEIGVLYNNEAFIEVEPDNACGSIFDVPTIVDFSRGHKLQLWASAKSVNGVAIPYIHIS